MYKDRLKQQQTKTVVNEVSDRLTEIELRLKHHTLLLEKLVSATTTLLLKLGIK